MVRADFNTRVKPYFSRRGESMDDFVNPIINGGVLILLELPGGSNTVLTAGVDAVRRYAQQCGVYMHVSEQSFGVVPSTITLDSVKLITEVIQDAFRGGSSSHRSLRIPIFTIEALNGDLENLQQTFLQLLYYATRTSPESKHNRATDHLLTISPIIRVLTPSLDSRLLKRINAKLMTQGGTGEKGPSVSSFDTRSFDRKHLLAVLQPEFPEEDLEINPDFNSLLKDHGGNAQLSLAIRSYARKGTIHLINGQFERIEPDLQPGQKEGELIYRPLGPKATFSTIFESLVSTKCYPSARSQNLCIEDL